MRLEIVEAKRQKLKGRILRCENLNQMVEIVSNELNEKPQSLKLYYEPGEAGENRYLFLKKNKKIAGLKEI